MASLNTGRKTGVPTPINPLTGEPKNRTEVVSEIIDAWPNAGEKRVHQLGLDIVEHEDGELPIFIATCRCGWESRPKSQSLARDDWRNHTSDLWEVAP